jgi:putative flavoprotein involved in K+ transport
MAIETTEVLVVGGGQAGLAVSEHLSAYGIGHLVLERNRIAESWRTMRWDSLVANGPAWHDRFPTLKFEALDPDEFASKDQVTAYFEAVAAKIAAPVRCGVEVSSVKRKPKSSVFIADTSDGTIEANYVVSATGPFQEPSIPPIAPSDPGLTQLHSSGYLNPGQLPEGAVLVVGAGSSGVQIADELLRSGRDVYLSVGAHDRPPRSYRGRDFVWWLGVLGMWEAQAPTQGAEHVTIAVSGAGGGHTVDFRDLAARGMTLVGLTETFENGSVRFAGDLQENIEGGDANYLELLREADAYIERTGLDLPQERAAHELGPMPDCVTQPLCELNLAQAGINSIIWATGFRTDYSWLQVDAFDASGKPSHHRGISSERGVYFIGLPWLTSRGSSFIWGVWHDAKHVAGHIAIQHSYLTYNQDHQPGGAQPSLTGAAT